jgi:hypothetical protein
MVGVSKARLPTASRRHSRLPTCYVLAGWPGSGGSMREGFGEISPHFAPPTPQNAEREKRSQRPDESAAVPASGAAGGFLGSKPNINCEYVGNKCKQNLIHFPGLRPMALGDSMSTYRPPILKNARSTCRLEVAARLNFGRRWSEARSLTAQGFPFDLSHGGPRKPFGMS